MVGPKDRKTRSKPLEKPKRKATGKPFEPGNCNGGRPKGSKNKFSRDLKEAYLLAANAAGGPVGWLPQKQSAAGEPVALYDRTVEAAADDAGGKSGRAAHRRGAFTAWTRTEAHVQACSSISLWFTRANLASIETWRLDALSPRMDGRGAGACVHKVE